MKHHSHFHSQLSKEISFFFRGANAIPAKQLRSYFSFADYNRIVSGISRHRTRSKRGGFTAAWIQNGGNEWTGEATLKLGILIRAVVRRVNASHFRISDMFCRSLTRDSLSILPSRESPDSAFCPSRTLRIYRFRPNARVDTRVHFRSVQCDRRVRRIAVRCCRWVVAFNVCIRVLIPQLLTRAWRGVV